MRTDSVHTLLHGTQSIFALHLYCSVYTNCFKFTCNSFFHLTPVSVGSQWQSQFFFSEKRQISC